MEVASNCSCGPKMPTFRSVLRMLFAREFFVSLDIHRSEVSSSG